MSAIASGGAKAHTGTAMGCKFVLVLLLSFCVLTVHSQTDSSQTDESTANTDTETLTQNGENSDGSQVDEVENGFENGFEEVCYEPTTDVGDEPYLAADVCFISLGLDRVPPDFITARAAYEFGINIKETTLKVLATTNYSTELYRKYAEFYNDDAFLDTYLVAAMEGEFPFVSDVTRAQVIEKLLVSDLLVQRVYFHIDSAVIFARNGNAADALFQWNTGLAAYYGADVDCAPFGNSQSRGVEFATISTDGISWTNDNILDSFQKGGEALEDGVVTEDVLDTLIRSRFEIIRSITIIYIQATFKYASLMEEALNEGTDVDKPRAEGFSYYLVVHPFVADVDPVAAQNVSNAFDLGKQPILEEVTQVKPLIRSTLEGLRIREQEVNDFDGTRKETYQPPEEPSCRTENPFSRVLITVTDSDR